MKVNFKNITVSNIITLAVAVAVITIIISIWINNAKRSHSQMVTDWRDQKDAYFKTNDESPILDRENFTGLNYFDPSIEFRTEAKLTLLNDSVPISMLRTDGKKEKYIKYAIAVFQLKKKEYQLTLFKSFNNPKNDHVVFVPFTDKTTGELTYKSGRYMDIEIKKDKPTIIDFNYAYNPFCAYNPRFSCPIPPISNFLDVEILAGEKPFEK
jgi:uncharacterized protein (DUF1684 family)